MYIEATVAQQITTKRATEGGVDNQGQQYTCREEHIEVTNT
jgi:membrane-bound inhibitor of C-type lysozyme